MDELIKRRVQDLLALHGWIVLENTAVACKDFPTAVGVKRALAWCYTGFEGSPVSLVGEYWSEGQNVLEARGVLIPKVADQSAVASLVARFAAGADAAVQASYAARLLRNFP
jgi:hypothetical protein